MKFKGEVVKGIVGGRRAVGNGWVIVCRRKGCFRCGYLKRAALR